MKKPSALIILLVIAIVLGFEMYGISLAFMASIVLGFIVMIAQPSPVVISLIVLFGGRSDICEVLAKWLGL